VATKIVEFLVWSFLRQDEKIENKTLKEKNKQKTKYNEHYSLARKT
jgi:hypothetical protein